MTRIRVALAAAAVAAGLLAVPAAAPAQAAGIPSICAPGPHCMNFWGGGFLVLDYNGIGVTNDWMRIVSIGGGNVEILDLLHGGCVGDWQDSPVGARAGGGVNCPSSGTAAWGTVDTLDYGACSTLGPAWFKIRVRHWNNAAIGIPGTNGGQVYLNTPGSCVAQFLRPVIRKG